MSTDDDVARSLGSWLREDRHEDADRVLNVVFDQVPATPQRQPIWRTWRQSVMSNMVRVAIVATAAVIVVFFGYSILQPGIGRGGPPAGSSPTPRPYTSLQPEPSGPVRILGLPPEGTIGAPTPGQLVMHFDGSSSFGWATIWVYADGRMISNRAFYVPADATDSYVGLVEQHLTASGVEYLRSRAMATGLFRGDLALDRDIPGYLGMDIWNGGERSSVTWWHGVPNGATEMPPLPSDQQAAALSELSILMTGWRSWPDSAWAEKAEGAYVPGQFGICTRGLPTKIAPKDAVKLLPQAAQDIYNAGEPMNGCSILSLDAARALAVIFERAGIPRDGPENNAFWLRYYLPHEPVAGSVVWFSFELVLPNGDLVWLGPG
jgi:hypothetical protein